MAIVVSYHGNRESDAALEEALSLGAALQTTLVVILAQRAGSDDQKTMADAEDRLWSHLDQADLPFEVRHARADKPIADSVLRVAGDVSADLIVLGLRPGGSRATTVGPNASRILLDAPCPVLTTTYREGSAD